LIHSRNLAIRGQLTDEHSPQEVNHILVPEMTDDGFAIIGCGIRQSPTKNIHELLSPQFCTRVSWRGEPKSIQNNLTKHTIERTLKNSATIQKIED
jgi:hypothetical protein